jgi:tryptophan synthase alpha chain
MMLLRFCEIVLLSLMPFHFENKPSLIAYVTCGDPNLAATSDVILAAIDAGASVIELGVPFSDPLADGPVIQRASERALKHGVSLQNVLTLAAEIREHSQSVGLVVFSYLNPILRMGLAKFCQVARLAGIDGTLITDLPVEESAEYLREARKNDLATIFLAAPTSTDQRLKSIAEVSTGFIYAISRTGVTGARQQMTGDARLWSSGSAVSPSFRLRLASESQLRSNSRRLANSRKAQWWAARSCS